MHMHLIISPILRLSSLKSKDSAACNSVLVSTGAQTIFDEAAASLIYLHPCVTRSEGRGAPKQDGVRRPISRTKPQKFRSPQRLDGWLHGGSSSDEPKL